MVLAIAITLPIELGQKLRNYSRDPPGDSIGCLLADLLKKPSITTNGPSVTNMPCQELSSTAGLSSNADIKREICLDANFSNENLNVAQPEYLESRIVCFQPCLGYK